MAIRANPKLVDELEAFGSRDVAKCYHCGNCSATCPFSEGDTVFPRRAMRQLQMGLEKRLEGSLDPWLCYYCGECSDDCPRDAEPGETMMSLRRWLITRYDFTGISKSLYRSRAWELGAILLVAILTAIGFLAYGFAGGDIGVYDGEDAFLPSSSIHWFGLGLASTLALILFINVVRMWSFTIRRNENVHVPLVSYITAIYLIPLHYFTQFRYARCDKKRMWAVHLPLMLSYFTMLVLIEVFLEQVQAGPEIDWRFHAFGYAASVGLIGAAVYYLYNRRVKRLTQYRFSHSTDWTFLVLVLLVGVTGVVQHSLHRADLPVAANVAYVVHMGVVVPMLVVGVLSKWSHIFYRPVGMYLGRLHLRGAAAREPSAGVLAQSQAA